MKSLLGVHLLYVIAGTLGKVGVGGKRSLSRDCSLAVLIRDVSDIVPLLVWGL